MIYGFEQDPLCYRGTTVLRNKADLKSQALLDEFEAAMFALRASEPWPQGDLGTSYYRGLHHHFFQDVFDWAGTYRTVRTAKGGNWFCYPENIEAEMARLFGWAQGRDWFLGHPRERFVRELAHFIAELNAIHPFREGNGRTQFALMSILTEVSGYGFNADALEPAVALDAMVQSFGGNNRNLERLAHALIA